MIANLGKKDLIAQWNRSVRLSNEKWVWLLSDDDIADPECVKYFYNALETTEEKFSVYRFNTILIDKNDEVVDMSPATLRDRKSNGICTIQASR